MGSSHFVSLSLRLFVSLGVALALALVAPAAIAQSVERRGGESTLHGMIISIDDGGVTIRTEFGATHVVPWDRVREVNDPVRENRIADFAETADALWRARSRVERNDVTLAEPLLATLFEQYHGKTHETALVVAEGLLRCRLARGAYERAVIPALEVTRLKRANVETISYSQLPPVFDSRFQLCTVLAPYWVDDAAREAVYQDLSRYEAHGDDVVRAMAALYARSMASAPPEGPIGNLPDHPGVSLLALAVASQSEDAAARERVRDLLIRNEPKQPEFARAWGRFFSGLSYLKETGVVRRQRGLMHLLYMPALYRDSQKYLSGIALRLAADTLDEMDQPEAAAALRDELASLYPFHPVQRLSDSRM